MARRIPMNMGGAAAVTCCTSHGSDLRVVTKDIDIVVRITERLGEQGTVPRKLPGLDTTARARPTGDLRLDYAQLMAEKAKTVEEYLERLSPEFREELERIRSLVLELAPEAEETMSYGMPTLKYRGRALVYFTASKKHLSFYPSSWAIEELAGELAAYKRTEHSIQFTPETALPTDLIERLVRIHLREIDAGRQ